MSATTLRHVNASGAYSFDYPTDWVATDAGASSQVSAPDRSIVMTFAPGARADLDRSSDALVEAVRSEYRDVEILATDRSDVDGSPGRMVSGLATNRSGLCIRFLAITVMESARTYSILVFTDARPILGRCFPRPRRSSRRSGRRRPDRFDGSGAHGSIGRRATVHR